MFSYCYLGCLVYIGWYILGVCSVGVWVCGVCGVWVVWGGVVWYLIAIIILLYMVYSGGVGCVWCGMSSSPSLVCIGI